LKATINIIKTNKLTINFTMLEIIYLRKNIFGDCLSRVYKLTINKLFIIAGIKGINNKKKGRSRAVL